MALGRLAACPVVVHSYVAALRVVVCHGSARYSRCHTSLVRNMPGYSRRLKGVSASSRILALLVLKPCDLVELTCHAGSKATQAVVHCLKRSHERAGNRVQKAVTAELLAQSVHACRLVQGLSAELNSIIWWPRRGVELYNVCPLHPELPAAFASSKPLHVFDSLVGCGQALHEEEPGSIRDKLPRGVLTLAQGIRPSAKVNTRSIRNICKTDGLLLQLW